MYLKILREMFDQMVVNKDASLIPKYYHKDMILYTNGEEMSYQRFCELHEEIYPTSIQYHIRYDEKTFLEQGNKLAGRVFITTTTPEEGAKEIEVILIVEFKDNKIFRIWELTFPDWSKMEAFKEV